MISIVRPRLDWLLFDVRETVIAIDCCSCIIVVVLGSSAVSYDVIFFVDG